MTWSGSQGAMSMDWQTTLSPLRSGTPRYRSSASDSLRWDGFEHRKGDIVVDTPPKCGTTWMQMCCLVIVHQSPVLPAPLGELAPWVDTVLGPPGRAHELLASQAHRRVMKTHTPLDGLPALEARVTYVCVARDPRDALFSLNDHRANTNRDAFQAARIQGLGAEEAAARLMPAPPEDPAERFWAWVDDDREPAESHGSGDSLRAILHHFRTFWDHRNAPNVALFHYADLWRDLDGQMRRLATLLGVEPGDETWPELVAATQFEAMKRNADMVAPGLTHDHWIDPAAFFRKGGTHRWRGVIDDADMPRYEGRVNELVPSDLASWVHHGWLGP